MSENPILLAVHLPKTGGTTFKNMLREVYQDRLIEIKGEVDGNRVAERVPENIPSLVAGLPLLSTPVVIYGHYYLDPFRSAYPNARLAVWLRDPVQRLLSNYFYAERSGLGQGHNNDDLYKEENIYRFVAQEEHHNTMSKMIGRTDINDFDFVGSTEEFDKSLALFSAIFSTKKAHSHQNKMMRRLLALFKSDEIHIKHKNRNPEKKSALYPVSEDLKQRILALNRDDEALYVAGLRCFDALTKQWLG